MHRLTRAAPWVALVLLVGLFCHQLLFTNRILARGDTYFYFYPYWQYRAEVLRDGQLPLWNPYLFMGAPFLANIQAGVLYPPNWLVAHFDAPQAVKISIVLHLLLAATGTYTLARRSLNLPILPALAAALAFAFGGHLLGKAEQINQLQGLAWLPWLLWLTHQLGQHPKQRTVVALGGLIALQLLAGHTQTTFISAVALGLWLLFSTPPRQWAMPLLGLLGAGVLAGGLAAAQLLPTLELSGLSFRSGGLSFSEAMSFSLHPFVVGRALLPGLTGSLFTEYLASVGLTGLATLALVAAHPRQLWQQPAARAAVGLSVVGLFFALGGYNPVYWLLVWLAPGFDLFRTPARWLALWAIGAALLVGLGLQQLNQSPNTRRQWVIFASGLVGLGGLVVLGQAVTPAGEQGPLGLPPLVDVLVWLGVAGLAGWLVFKRWPTAVAALLAVEFFLASSALPLNMLTGPEAWTSVRPAMTQLLAANQHQTPPDRFVSMSALLFDPGDLSELRQIWEPQLSEDGMFTMLVATKAKEVLSPNLPLAWRVPSVDGYDGGILPLRTYAEFTQAFTDANDPSPDGRLREYMQQTPSNWLLNVTNTRWLITDKVGDVWQADIYYDLQFSQSLQMDSPLAVGYLPPFAANTLAVIVHHAQPQNTPLLQANITFADGQTDELTLLAGQTELAWETAQPLTDLTLIALTDGLTLDAATLVDNRTRAFQPLALGPYRLAHNGDVKIYENLNAWPRIFITDQLLLTAETRPQSVTIRSYSPERIEVVATLATAGYLVVLDSDYPGWQAQINGQPAEITVVNGLFRAVALPAGEHSVTFHFEQQSFTNGLWVTGASLLIALLLMFIPLRSKLFGNEISK